MRAESQALIHPCIMIIINGHKMIFCNSHVNAMLGSTSRPTRTSIRLGSTRFRPLVLLCLRHLLDVTTSNQPCLYRIRKLVLVCIIVFENNNRQPCFFLSHALRMECHVGSQDGPNDGQQFRKVSRSSRGRLE